MNCIHDAACISDNYWLTNRKPCLTYGLQGLSYFTIRITNNGPAMHSEVLGGVVHEPLTDLAILLSKLVDFVEGQDPHSRHLRQRYSG